MYCEVESVMHPFNLKKMKISLHFKNDKITPCKWAKGSSNTHTVPCQKMEYSVSNGRLTPNNTPVVSISFSPSDLLDESVKLVILNRKIGGYGDSIQKYIEIPCSELYGAEVRTDMR